MRAIGIVFAADMWRGRVIRDDILLDGENGNKLPVLTPRNILDGCRGFQAQPQVWWDKKIDGWPETMIVGWQEHKVSDLLKLITGTDPLYAFVDIEVLATEVLEGVNA